MSFAAANYRCINTVLGWGRKETEMMRFVFVAIALLLGSAAVAQDAYAIKPGDRLRIEVLEDPTLNREVLVLPDGSVSFPFAGSVPVGGRTVGSVTSSITSGIQSNFATPPNVFVTVLSTAEPVVTATGPARIDVYVLGEVEDPGVQRVSRNTTLLQFLAQTGGFTRFAATQRIQVRRMTTSGQEQVFTVDYKAMANGAATQNNIVLRDGDVVLVPERRLFE